MEPELFATYLAIFAESRAVVHAHVEHLSAQVAAIVADGIARDEFADCDPTVTGRAIFQATARFHDPAYAREWQEPGADGAFDDRVEPHPARADGAGNQCRSGREQPQGPQEKIACAHLTGCPAPASGTILV